MQKSSRFVFNIILFPRTRDQKNSTRRTRLFVVVCFEGCQVPTYAGCLRAVYRRAPGENAAYQVQVQGDGGQKAGETAAESESCCLSILFAKFSSNFFKNSSQLPTTCIVFVCTLDDEAWQSKGSEIRDFLLLWWYVDGWMDIDAFKMERIHTDYL